MTLNPGVDLKFLAIFNADPVAAEKAYGELRQRLRRFFEWKGCTAPEDLAQETLKRGFVRMDAGQSVYCENPSSYFLGIANLVLLEWWKRRKEEQLDPEDPAGLLTGNPEKSIHQRILLAKILDSLSVEDREFLIAYTFNDKGELARSRGESINALRLRAYRIRAAIRDEFDETPGKNEMGQPDTPLKKQEGSDGS